MGATLAGKTELTPEDWVRALESGIEGVIRRGKAAPGDKTMTDCHASAVEALKAAAAQSADFASALRRAGRGRPA